MYQLQLMTPLQNRRPTDSELMILLSSTAHAWWEVLADAVRRSLCELWRAEVDTSSGPVFTAPGHLQQMVDPRVTQEPRYWFATRLALSNFAWARRRVDASEHDGTIIGKIRAWFRLRGVRIAQKFGDQGGDHIDQRFRRFLDHGHPAFDRETSNESPANPVFVRHDP